MTFPLAFDPVWFWVLFALTILAMLWLRHINKPLTTSAAPHGIVSLQIADLAKAKAIFASWDPPTRQHVAMGLGFDYLFLALYGTAFALGCAWASQELACSAILAGLGPWLAWGAWLAAVLDAIENAALWKMLRTAPTAQLTTIVRACAYPKFVLVGLAALYVVAGLVAAIVA